MSLITNTKTDNHIKVFIELFKDSTDIFIAVAFFKKTGFNLISKDFQDALERGTSIVFICGLDFFQTEPDALKAVYSLSQKYSNCKLLIQEQKKQSTFHPKLYCFSNNNERTLIVGSANFTKGGFEGNYELSVRTTFQIGSDSDKELRLVINDIKNNCVEYSDIEISNYARKYQIYKCNETKAKKNSEAEYSALNLEDGSITNPNFRPTDKGNRIMEKYIYDDYKTSIEDFSKYLSDKYINDSKQKEIFLREGVWLKVRLNYVAGLLLTSRGMDIFSPKDIREVIRKDLIPSLSKVDDGSLSSLILTEDVHRTAKIKYNKGYTCLEKVSRGNYRFVGFLKKDNLI